MYTGKHKYPYVESDIRHFEPSDELLEYLKNNEVLQNVVSLLKDLKEPTPEELEANPRICPLVSIAMGGIRKNCPQGLDPLLFHLRNGVVRFVFSGPTLLRFKERYISKFGEESFAELLTNDCVKNIPIQNKDAYSAYQSEVPETSDFSYRHVPFNYISFVYRNGTPKFLYKEYFYNKETMSYVIEKYVIPSEIFA